MKPQRLLWSCLVAALAAAAVQAQDAPVQVDGCRRLAQPYMSTTWDFGASFIPFRLPTQRSLSLTWGLAAIDDEGTLVMQADDALWGSDNDGCTWNRLLADDTTAGIFRVTAGPDGHAYAWQDNGAMLHHVSRNADPGPRWDLVTAIAPVRGMKGFGVDPTDPLHVRTAGDDGQIYESFDGGARWGAIGVAARPGGSLGYVINFDPHDFNHAVYGRVTDGGFVTFDAGRTWTRSTGLASVDRGSVNLFNAVISPADGNVVFAMGIDITESLNNAPSRGRHIYASVDGGISYIPVIDHLTDGVVLANGPVMQCDWHDGNLLRFLSTASPVFGGTTFYEYDLATNTLRGVHNDSIPKVRVIEQSRLRPGAMHVGFDFF